MQDAFGRDMFNVPNINSSRYNGHIHSSSGKGAGGKRDRKGCTKGKIEAIMKNNTGRPKVCVPVTNKKAVPTIGGNHVVYTTPVKLECPDQEDPYTFTESEPQALSLYQASGSSTSKKQPASARLPNMGCTEKPKVDTARVVVKPNKTAEGSSKMNKLQAEIARNKVIGKRRKVEQVPSAGLTNDWSVSSTKKESGKICIAAKFVPRKSTWQKECKSRHELLQRIHQAQSEAHQYTRDLYPLGLEMSDSDDDSENSRAVYERHWFSRSGVCGRKVGGTRESRVEETRTELRRKLTQTLRGLANADLPSRDLVSAVITAARKFPNATASILDPSSVRSTPKVNRGARFLLTGEKCSYSEGCNWQSLPCTRHCSQHIMYNVDQCLFSHCTAKFSDNTQCSVPVFNVLHELPLCPEHASKHDNYKRFALESKPSKKVAKKSRVLGSSRSAKRNQKKRKKPPSTSEMSPPSAPAPPPTPTSAPSLTDDDFVQAIVETESHLPPDDVPTHLIESALSNDQNPAQFEGVINLNCSDPVEEVSEEVLAIASLDPAELASQASRLLEEHDITNMLNQISPDAFNDLFTGLDKNGEYEPTREETEELERALEAVDNDVRSLERMTRSLPLLQLPLPLDTMTLLDDAATAGPFPPFQNGFPPQAATDIHPS